MYEISRILTAPDGGVAETRGVGGIVARLWRTIMHELNISPNKFELNLAEFVANARKKVPDNRVSRLFTRGNLRRELEKPTMTFKVFIKGIKMLKVTRMRIAVELEFNTGKKTLHSTVVDFGTENATEIFTDDNDPDE